MAAPTPFFAGKNCTLIFMLGDKKVKLFNKTWSVEEDAVEAHDDVGGEDRTRDQKITNGFNIKISSFQEDLALIAALVADTQQKDTLTQPQDAALGIIFKPNDGSKSGMQAREVTLMSWALTEGGRTERFMVDSPLRARYFEPVAVT